MPSAAQAGKRQQPDAAEAQAGRFRHEFRQSRVLCQGLANKIPRAKASSTEKGVWMPPTTRLNSDPFGPCEASEKLLNVSLIGQISGLPLLLMPSTITAQSDGLDTA